MSVPQEAVVREVLGRQSRDKHIHAAARGGWVDYTHSSDAGRWRRKGTRASIVWERMVDRAINSLLPDRGVVSLEKNDSILFIADDAVVFRFKKGDGNRFSKNYPTETALLFHQHEEIIPGVLSHHHRVEVVYVLNSRETEISSICVVAREGAEILWWYEIEAGGAVIQPLPLLPTAPRPNTGLVRVKTDLVLPDKREQEK